MAYDYEKTKAAYEKLSKEQQKQFVEQNKNNANVQQFAKEYAAEMDRNSRAKVVQSPYENQGAGTYKFNESTGYYENQTDTSKNTVNQWLTPRPETKQTTIQETPVKQEEKVITTDTKNQTSNVMTPLSNDYYQQTSDIALNTIKNNLNQYKQTNPEYFTDYDSFKKNFSYDLRNDEQKNVLDTWYKGYEKWLTLSATPVNELYTQYQDGSISLNDLENLRISNPAKYAELQNQINKGNIISAYDDDKWNNGTNIQEVAYNLLAQAVTKLSSWDYGTSEYFDEFKNNMNSPEMLDLQDKTTELENQAKDIEDEIASISKDVENEYEWTWATRSKINAIIADRTYDLQQQLRTINNEYNRYATQYNNRANQYQQEFQLRLQEYQLNMQARNQQMNELWFAMDLMNFETNEQKAQREWDYWVKQQEYTNGNINSSDYQTRYKAALTSVQNLLSQYEGIPMVRSAEQMAEDVLKGIDQNWTTLWEELSKIISQIKQKPEYKKLYNATYWTAKWIEWTYNIWWIEYVLYDGQLMTASDFNKKYWWVKTPANYTVVDESVFNTLWADFVSSHLNKTYWWQCGKFVNDYLKKIWAGKIFWNEDIKTREWWINSDEAKVWTIAVFDYWFKSDDGINHWHVGIVVRWPDKNWNILVKDSNYDSDGIIKTREVNVNDASLKWFIDPSLSQDWNQTTLPNNYSTYTGNDGYVTLWSTKLTPTQFDDYVKEYIDWNITYSEIDKLWNDALNKVTQRKYELLEQWYEASKKITDPNRLSTAEKNRADYYNKNASSYQTAIDLYETMKTAYDNIDKNKNAGTQAIVYAYNKIMDEWSVVREWEYARTADWQDLWSKYTAKVTDYFTWWQGISKKQLKELVDMAEKFAKNSKDKQMEVAKQVKVAIDTKWLTPELVLPVNIWNELQNNNISTWSNWNDWLNKSSDVFKVSTNIWWFKAPANFYQS